MANIELAGFVYTGAGVAVENATVNLYDRNTTTPVRATTTTNSAGYWTISHATEGRFDIEIVDGTTSRRIKYDSAIQLQEVETANLLVRNPGNTFKYDIVPGAIVADRQLNLPVITGTDTLAVLGLAQTFTAAQTFNAKLLVGQNLSQFGSTTALTNPNAGVDDLIVTVASGNVGLMLNTPTATASAFIGFSDDATGNVQSGLIAYNHTANSLSFRTNDVDDRLVIGSAGTVYINDTANANMTVGLTIMGGGADNQHLALKNSDVGHPMTGVVEADTFGAFAKGENGSGGLRITGYKDADDSAGYAMILEAVLGEAADTTDTSTSIGVLHLTGWVTDAGTGRQAVADAGNMLVIDNAGTVRFLVKGNGALHATNVTAGEGDLDGTALDDYDDVGLVRAFQRQRVNDIGIAMSKWDESIRANRDDLITLGVLSSTGDFYNMQRMNDLLGGALWQVAKRGYERDERIAALEGEINELKHRLEAGRN